MRLTYSSVAVAEVLMKDPFGRHYGYSVGRSARVRSGVIYPMLDRWLEDGWLQDGWEEQPPRGMRKGPRRRYYTLTDTGRRELGSALESAAHDERFVGFMTWAPL